MSDDVLETAYLATDYGVEGPHGPFVLRIGEPSPEADRVLDFNGLTEWAFVTAYNPGSVRLPDAENDRRMAELEAAVIAGGWPHYPGVSVGRDGGWPEPSFLVLGISQAAAIELGRRFGQNAIVVGRVGEPARLVWVA